MTIRVPLRLSRQSAAYTASALYIPSSDTSELFAVCARIDLDPSGRVFAVEGGILLLLERPAVEAVPGAIRLRKLTEGLYLPADARLVPDLLDDEAAGVVRDRGLVFLHGGRVLEFDRRAAIEPSELLEARTRQGRPWCSLPEPDGPAERLEQIVLETPDPDPEDIYREMRNEMNRRNPRSGSSQHDEKSEGKAKAGERVEKRDGEGEVPGSEVGDTAGAGTGEPGRGSLRSLGEYAARGILRPLGEAFSTMREKIRWEWVDRSALLKKLVREFREGDKTVALRRAIPLTRPGDPWIPVRANWLPLRPAVYSLAALLRRPARGESVPVLMGRDDVIRELTEEYRKAAQEAVKQGDFRRAAYIYGILLRDDRMAASALGRAGLHHDAAIIYANKLNDRAAAAQAFEAAGEIDRALDLYRHLGQHERAGDLLRRIGEEEAALAEYIEAAADLAGTSANYLAAGALLLKKARRPALAIHVFQSGWELRPARNSTQCGLELARLHAGSGAIDAFQAVLDQADAMYETPGFPFDGYFYTEIVRMADNPPLESIADVVKDRALQAIARSLRRGLDSRRASSVMVSKLLGRSKLWPAPLVSDADFALTAAIDRRPEESVVRHGVPSGHSLQVGRGSVTAACQASGSGEIFLGFDNGLICAFRPEREQVVELPKHHGTVIALSVDVHGQTLAALYESPRGLRLCCFWRSPDGSYRSRPEIALGSAQRHWLTPILSVGVERLVGVSAGNGLFIFDAASGLPREERLRIADDESAPPAAGILLAAGAASERPGSPVMVLTHDHSDWMVLDPSNDRLYPTGCRWVPAESGPHSLRIVPVSWRYARPALEMVGVDSSGGVHAAEFSVDPSSGDLRAARVTTTDGGYLGAAHAGKNAVVAISRTSIDWLGFHGDRFRLLEIEECSLPSAVACFATHSQDALVVCSRGLLIRVPLPPRAARIKKRIAHRGLS
jgi:tetratricopeptide (TPR) repeat protein